VHAYLSAHADVYRQEYHDNRVLLRCLLPKHLVHHIQEPGVAIRVLENGH
jgi:GTP-binding protein HflX